MTSNIMPLRRCLGQRWTAEPRSGTRGRVIARPVSYGRRLHLTRLLNRKSRHETFLISDLEAVDLAVQTASDVGNAAPSKL